MSPDPASSIAGGVTGKTPLIRIGPGAYRHDLLAEDLRMFGGHGTTPKLDLRFLVREPADVYHAKADQYLSSHALGEFRRCPLLYRKKKLGLVPEPESTAYVVGRAAHTLILEGRQRYEREFAIGGPINPKTGQPFGSQTKAFAEWAERQGRPVLSDSHAATVEQMKAAVDQHTLAAELLSEGIAEGVVRGTYVNVPCQARIDLLNPLPAAGLIDLKTCDDLDEFEYACRSFGYLHQVAFYRALLAVVSKQQFPVHMIAVEKREPFRCGVWRVADAVLERAAYENEQAIEELTRCNRSGDWFTRYETLRTIQTL